MRERRNITLHIFCEIYSENTKTEESHQLKRAVSMHKAEIGGDFRKRFAFGQVEPLKNIDEHCSSQNVANSEFGKKTRS